MTMDHDYLTDTRLTDPTATDGDRAVDSETDRRSRLSGLVPSTFQAGVIGLVALVALAGVITTAPAAAGLSSGPPAPSVDPGTTAPAAVETPGPTSPVDRPEISGGFSRATYTGVAGDPVRIRYTADNPDGDEYLLIGGNRLSDTGQSVGFVDVVKISDTSETTINTRTIGTDASNVKSCGLESTSCDLKFVDEDGNPVAKSLDNLSAFSGATGAGGLARPLAPQRYRLAITNGTFVVEDSGAVTPTESADQADLVLEKPRFHDEVEVFTSVDPSALNEESETESIEDIRSNGLDRTEVTKGNRIVLGFESTGIWGALSHFAGDEEEFEPGQAIDHEVLTDLLDAEEGVSLRVRQTNPGMNQAPSELDLSRADPGDVKLFVADATELETPDAPGRFYLVIDTSDGGAFTEGPAPGDEFAVEFALEGTEGERYSFADDGEPPAAFEAASANDDDISAQFPYWGAADGTASAEASFSVRERYVRYDHVTDDGEILVEADDGRITGTTSLLPVREMSATFVNDAGDAPFRTESPLEVSDGNFSVDVDLNGTAPGTRLNYELYEGSTLRDSRTVIVVGDADNPDELEIEDAPKNVTVTEGGNLSALRATARNAGGLTGEGELTLTVDNGSEAGSWGVRLAPDESRTYGFGSVTLDLDPGTYPFTLRLDGDTHGGTLVVESDPATTTIDDDSESNADANGSATDDDGTGDGNETDTDDGDDGSDTDGSGDTDGSNSDSDADQGSDGEGGSDTTTDETPDDAPPDDGDSDGVGMLPLPFGTREAFGGTVLVGAIHILGHWV
ncbi:BGTF surface domain-containing protein [Halorubrum sp. CGM5_25_10-8B]|uniref:BGTF surface domain-containing protein n=1 Tax=Halorubrum sp. CGM5_25_10-8B TaxID=2518115 RepID=UPI0018EE76AB|nr:BGTF surface domain-containing protein [Halorubrum sp. CGM5_25_10-8B]